LKPRRPRGGSPERRVTKAAVRREILVFTEGRVTEQQYVVHWHRRCREHVLVTVDAFHGGPLQLVEHAVRAKKLAARESRRGRGRAYDEIWCFHDVDDHERRAEAAVLAKAHGIKLAVSNPCIELWFILHFEDQTAHMERDAAQSRSKKLLGCGKVLTEQALTRLDDGLDDARRRANLLDTKHKGDGSPRGSNPSTSAGRLIDSIRAGT
jgi:hypothetical protein